MVEYDPDADDVEVLSLLLGCACPPGYTAAEWLVRLYMPYEPPEGLLTRNINSSVHSTYAVLALKDRRAAARDRKMLRKSSKWRMRRALKDPMLFWGMVPSSSKRRRDADVRWAVGGGSQIGRDDDELSVEEEETDVEVSSRPSTREIPLYELLVQRKPHQRSKKGDRDFEVIFGSKAVIALDDGTSPDAELDETWEYLDIEDAQSEGAAAAPSPKASYAEMAGRLAWGRNPWVEYRNRPPSPVPWTW